MQISIIQNYTMRDVVHSLLLYCICGPFLYWYIRIIIDVNDNYGYVFQRVYLF